MNNHQRMKFDIQSILPAGCVTLLALIAASLMQSHANADIFHWGDFTDTDVMFLNVTENNDGASSLFAPMPGTGGPLVMGNTLSLASQGFSSQSSNNSADLIDSTFSTLIMASPGRSIERLSINELGDYSLGGLPGGAANAEIGGAFFWTVLEIDHVAVNMNTQATNLVLGTGSGPNGGKYERPGDDGTAVIWNGVASIDLSGFLSAFQIAGSVTKIQLTFSSTLQTSAADDITSASINKGIAKISVAMTRLPGDYNDNGIVDAADYTVWLDSFGSFGSTTDLAADGSSRGGEPDGVVNHFDYDFWKANFGNTFVSGQSSETAVPESTTLLLASLAVLLLPFGRRGVPWA